MVFVFTKRALLSTSSYCEKRIDTKDLMELILKHVLVDSLSFPFKKEYTSLYASF